MDNKKDKSKDKNKAVNDKLKKMAKLDLQKKLFFGKKNNSVFETFETKESNLQMTNNIGSYMVNFAMGNVKKWGKILAVLVIGLVVIVNSISSGLSAVASVVPSTPKMSEEDKKEIIELMKQLDADCGKKLSSGYTLVGSKDTNWKSALSIYFAYHNNDLVNQTTGTYMDMIEEASRKYGVDKWLICGVISTESDWIMHQPNQYGACGYMQVTPVCAQECGFNYEKVKTDIYTNVMCGTAYLKKMFDMFGQTTLALAGYNAGPGNVQKYNGVPPFAETQNYVRRVQERANYYRTGQWTVPDGSVALEVELNRIYNIMNEVVDTKTLRRRDFYSTLDGLGYTTDQRMLATALYEADFWDLFENEEDYNFKIVGSAVGSFEGVQFINGTRNSGQVIIDYALTQVGQRGGQPYWSYYGFTSRVAWCACFVNWVMRTEPTNAGASYPTAKMTGNNAYCPTLVNWFRSNNRWAKRGYDNLVPGDVIFFDWESNGEVDHVGLVVGRDDKYVYTVEGNSGDMVRTKQYALNSSSIAGYGLMNY
jgi:hypothetical protein